MRVPKSAALVLALAFLTAGSVAAKDYFTVTLSNGSSFETLRQPQQAPWDDNVLLVLTDSGNWIGVPKDSVDTIIASIEKSGFGKVIDNKTVAIGNIEASEEDEDEEDGEGGENGEALDRLDSFLEGLQDLATAGAPNYNTEQFVNPDDAGLSGSGFPADFAVEP